MCLPILNALRSGNDNWLGSSNGGTRGAALARADDQLLAVVRYCTLDGGTEWQSGLTAAGGAGISLPGLSLLVLDSILRASGAGYGWSVDGGEGRTLWTTFSLRHVLQVGTTPNARTTLRLAGRTIRICIGGDGLVDNS